LSQSQQSRFKVKNEVFLKKALAVEGLRGDIAWISDIHAVFYAFLYSQKSTFFYKARWRGRGGYPILLEG